MDLMGKYPMVPKRRDKPLREPTFSAKFVRKRTELVALVEGLKRGNVVGITSRLVPMYVRGQKLHRQATVECVR